MAVIKYGSLVTEIKGKIGGTVFQGGISGPIAGNKAHISKTNVTLGKQQRSTSEKVINQHNTLALLATNWRNLSGTERAAWDAAAIDFQFTNKFGELYTASGFQVYMSLGINAWNMVQILPTSPPTPVTLVTANPFTIVPATDPNTFKINMAIDPSTYIVLYASVAMSPGIKLRPGFMKAVKIFDTGFGFPYDFTADYKAVFGTIPPHGTAWFRCVPVSVQDYRQGLPVDMQYSW